MKKFDLLMWSYQSEVPLPFALGRIESVIPEKFVNRKIMVDGGSTDRTEVVADFFGWEFHRCRKGIPFQANMAFELAETDFVCSFEHDILLCDNWLERILPTMKDSDVACSQGIRLCLNPTMRAIEIYGLGRDYVHYTSIDNNMYRRKLILDLGGFDEVGTVCSSDRELQDRVRENGYRWLISEDIVSDHMVFDFFEYARKAHERRLLNDYKGSVANVLFVGKVPIMKYRYVYFFDFVVKVLMSPFVGVLMFRQSKVPSVLWGYPYWRAYKLKTLAMLLGQGKAYVGS